MRSKSWVILTVFLLLIIQVVDIQAQIIQKKVSLSWTENLIFKLDDENTLEFLNFEDAITDFKYGDLPVFFQKIAVDNFFSEYDIQLSNEKYEFLSQEDRKLVPSNLLKPVVEPEVHCYADKGKPYAVVTLLPFVSATSSQVKKLVSFEMTLIPKPSAISAKAGHAYASNSVLANGLWYKVAVTETGLHKVTFENLKDMG